MRIQTLFVFAIHVRGIVSTHLMQVDYIFYGTASLHERCRNFFDDMQHKFASHSEFKREFVRLLVDSVVVFMTTTTLLTVSR